MRAMKDMPYVMGVKIRIYPSYAQKDIIAHNDGLARFIYNRLVARDRDLFSLRKVKCYVKPVADRIEYLESLDETPAGLKNAYPFLEDERTDAQAIANAVKNYRTAWYNFRHVRGSSIPTFHKKGYEKSYLTNAHMRSGAETVCESNVHLTDRNHIMLPKLGRIKFKDSGRLGNIFSRTSETRIGAIRISMNAAGEYYAALQVGSVEPFHRNLPRTGSCIGIDVNIENLYTDSEGTVIENPKLTKRFEHRISKAQRKLSRRYESAKKDKRSLGESKNYQKQRVKVAALNLKKARMRNDFQHIVSKKLVESQDYIFAENISSKNLLQNHCLAKAISDCAWSEFLRKTEYKAVFYGKVFMKVPAMHTTQTCSYCGHVMSGNAKLTLDVREWVCPECGASHERDHNAAINIRNKGLMALDAL